MLSALTARSRYAIGLIGVLLLFLPKMNLVAIGNESAGLRVDDIFLGLFSFLLLIGFVFNKNKSITKLEAVALVTAVFFLLSNIINILYFQRSSLLYGLRFIEYFIFFYIGAFYFATGNIVKITKLLLVINGIVMVLQTFDIVGGFTSAGATASVGSRVVGLTGGPWEIGTCLNFFLGVLSFQKRQTPFRVLLWFIITTGLIFLTGARMPLVANIAILCFWFFKRSPNKVFALSSIFASLAFIMLAVSLIPNQISSRSKNLTFADSISVLVDNYNATTVDEEFIDFPYVQGDDDSDLSWLIRASKWSTVVKIWASNPLTWLLGVGPGTWGTALDGGWLRLFSESGVLGGVAFVLLLQRFAKMDDTIKATLIALYINMIMIDAEIAYKIMSFTFFACGYFFAKKRKATSIHAHPSPS